MGTPNKEDFTPCPVCGYSAEGNHYGILSCRSCASFFKRVVEKGDSFDRHPPPVEGEPFNYCNIKENRNSCKQCRYLKCLETGMQPSAVQPKREPTGSQSNRKRKTLFTTQGELADDISGLSVSSVVDAGSDVNSSASGSPAPFRKVSGYLDQPQTTFSEFCRTNPEFQRQNSRSRVGSAENSPLKRASIPREEKPAETAAASKKDKEKDQAVMLANRLSSFDSGDGDEGSSNDSSRAPQLGNSARSSSDRFMDVFEENIFDEEDNRTPSWVGRKNDCPACPKDSCNAGLKEYISLVQTFTDHTRQMQLSFTSIEDYIQEITTGLVLREMEPADINKLSSVELAGLLFWVEKMGHFDQIPGEDQVNLVKRYSVRKLSLDHFYSASKYKDHAKLRSFVLNNYTYVPANKTGFETPSEDARQREAKFEIFKHTFERFWVNVIDRFVKLKVGDADMVFLHHMLMWSPLNKQFVSDPTKSLLMSRRNWAIQMIFEYFYHTNVRDPELRVGELINLYQEIETVTDQHCADVHVAKLFDFCDLSDYWYDRTCYSAINTDRPLDCALDVNKLLTMFADLAHNLKDKVADDPSEILPELEQMPRRVNYSLNADEPMKIIKWMRSQENHDKVRQISQKYSVKEQTLISHVPSRLDFVIPSTKNGKPIYPTSVLQKKQSTFLEDIREAVRDSYKELSEPPHNPLSVSSSNVSPEGIKAESPEPFTNEVSMLRRSDSESTVNLHLLSVHKTFPHPLTSHL